MTNPTNDLDEILGAYGSYLTSYNDHAGRYDPLDLEQATAALETLIAKRLQEAMDYVMNSKLNTLMDYWARNRQVGHTSLSIAGLNYDKPAIFLVDSQREVQRIRSEFRGEVRDGDIYVGRVMIRSTGILNDPSRLFGYNLPLIIDHYALQNLHAEQRQRLTKLLEGMK